MAGTLGATINTDTELADLVAGPHSVKPAVVASGEGVLARGTVLELNTSTNKYEVVTAASSGNARAILAEDIDATSADVTTQIYLAGKYRRDKLVWPTATTAQKNTALIGLQDRGILVDLDFFA